MAYDQTMSFVIDSQLKEKLETAAFQDFVSQAKICRAGIEWYLSQRQEPKHKYIDAPEVGVDYWETIG